MVSLWCSKEEFMTASQLPCCSRDRRGSLCPSSMAPPLISRAFPIPSPTLGPKGYRGRSPWLVSYWRGKSYVEHSHHHQRSRCRGRTLHAARRRCPGQGLLSPALRHTKHLSPGRIQPKPASGEFLCAACTNHRPHHTTAHT